MPNSSYRNRRTSPSPNAAVALTPSARPSAHATSSSSPSTPTPPAGATAGTMPPTGAFTPHGATPGPMPWPQACMKPQSSIYHASASAPTTLTATQIWRLTSTSCATRSRLQSLWRTSSWIPHATTSSFSPPTASKHCQSPRRRNLPIPGLCSIEIALISLVSLTSLIGTE